MYELERKQANRKNLHPVTETNRTDQSNYQPETPSVVKTRLEALKILSYSILREIESMNKYEEPSSITEITLADEVEHFEADLIRSALIRTGGNQRKAAKLLRIKPTTLNMKIMRYKINIQK